MNPNKTEDFKLRDWQKIIINCINGHDDFVGSESFQSLSDYAINEASEVKVKFPKGYGNSTLTAYVCSNYPSLFIYLNSEHLKEIEQIQSEWGWTMNKNTTVLSVFELLYTMNHNASVRSQYYVTMDQMKSKFADKKVVIVDSVSKMPGGVEAIENVILTLAKGSTIFLG